MVLLKMLARNFLILTCLGAASPGFSAAKVQQTAPGHATRKPAARQGFLISIDGLTPQKLQTLLAEGALPTTHGFRWLATGALQTHRALPATVTLTAPSHVSILTCSSPARHGIVANNFLRQGHEVSGFDTELGSETLVEAAHRQHRRVLSFGYVSVDGRDSRRSADAGISYPEARYLPPSRVHHLEWGKLARAEGWLFRDHGQEASEGREITLTSVLNPVTGESVAIPLFFSRTKEGIRALMGTGKDLTQKFVGETLITPSPSTVLDVFVQETDPRSALVGVKRRLSFRFRALAPDRWDVYEAGASYNNAHPAAFRQALDDAGLVWPTKQALLGAEDPVAYVEEMAVIDRFLADAALFGMARYPHDLVLFYQPLVDSTEHAFEGRLPLPFSSRAKDPISQAYLRAFTIVDANLDRLLAGVSAHDPILLSGDHGMDPVRTLVNVAALHPDWHGGRVVYSGALMMLYPSPALAQDPAHREAVAKAGEVFAKTLRGLTFANKPVAGDLFDARQVPARDWSYGEALWVFTPASTFLWRFAPNDADLFSAPDPTGPWGMHGHSLSDPLMATEILAHIPGQAGRDVGEASLLQVVPTLVKAMGWQNPRQCEGRALY